MPCSVINATCVAPTQTATILPFLVRLTAEMENERYILETQNNVDCYLCYRSRMASAYKCFVYSYIHNAHAIAKCLECQGCRPTQIPSTSQTVEM